MPISIPSSLNKENFPLSGSPVNNGTKFTKYQPKKGSPLFTDFIPKEIEPALSNISGKTLRGFINQNKNPSNKSITTLPSDKLVTKVAQTRFNSPCETI